jgi:hypothetical protein
VALLRQPVISEASRHPERNSLGRQGISNFADILGIAELVGQAAEAGDTRIDSGDARSNGPAPGSGTRLHGACSR